MISKLLKQTLPSAQAGFFVVVVALAALFLPEIMAKSIQDVQVVSQEEMNRIWGGTYPKLAYNDLAQVDSRVPLSTELLTKSVATPAGTEPEPIQKNWSLNVNTDLSFYNVDIAGNRAQSFRNDGYHWLGTVNTLYAEQVNPNTILNSNIRFQYTDDPSVDRLANGHIQNANVIIASEKYEFQGGDVVRQYSPMSFNGVFKGASYQRRFGDQNQTVADVMGGAVQQYWNELIDRGSPFRSLDRYVYGGRIAQTVVPNLVLGGTAFGFNDAQHSSPKNFVDDSGLGRTYLPSQEGRVANADLTWNYMEQHQARIEISNADFTPNRQSSAGTFNDYAGLFQHSIEREEFASNIHFARINPFYANPFGFSQNDIQEVAAQHQLRLYQPIQPYFNYRFSENNLRKQLFFKTTTESFEPGIFSANLFSVTNLNLTAAFSRLKAYSNPSGLQDTTTDMILARPSYAVGPIRTELNIGRILQTESVSTGLRSREWNLGWSGSGDWEMDDWRVSPFFSLGYQTTDSVGIQYTDLQQQTLAQQMTLANKQLGEVVCTHRIINSRRPSIQFDPASSVTDINQSYEQTFLSLEVAPKLPETWKNISRVSFVYEANDTSFVQQKTFDVQEQIFMLKLMAAF